MNKLELMIKSASQKYYTDGSSDISDEEFDVLLEKLRDEDPNSSLLKTGHGYDVTKDSTPGEKIAHKYGEAGSLDKCRSWKELSTDIRNNPVCLSLKLDGISVVLYYKDNVLVRALTRGDGKVGIDITDKVIKIWPRYIQDDTISFTGAIRGEILMSYENFNSYKTSHPEMKNPRNTTAGIINSKTSDGVEYLTIIVYTVVGYEGDDNLFSEYYLMNKQLRKWFGDSNVVKFSSPTLLSEDNIDTMMNELKVRWYGTYPADGIVITDSTLTRNGNEIVYRANAYKFSSEIKQSTVKEVEWNMSKTRYAVPKVHIEPIELAGTTVEWCTGYNAQYILDNKIGPGSVVTVEKRGEIIPNIQEILLPSSEFSMISKCPDCGCNLKWSGVNLVCPNSECVNAKEKDLLIWFNKLVPTDGLGDMLILKFLQELELDDISIESVMKFDHKLAEDMNSVQWNLFAKTFNQLVFGPKSFKLVSALEAINVPRLGSINAIKLSMLPDMVSKLVEYSRNDSDIDEGFWFELETKFGAANTASCRSNLNKFSRLATISDRIIWTSENVQKKGKVAITGKLSVKRSDFEKELRSKGYEVGDVSANTNFLITDDPTSNSSKNIKADKLGITKLTEAEFRNQYLN